MSYQKISSTSPEAQSSSVVENIRALSTLFPSVVHEGKVDIKALQQLLGESVEEENELYGLQWKGKAQSRRAATTVSLGTLRPCKEESVNWDTTKNLYIEGDNLEVLKLLRKSYAGKVKMIYIDPPYNTGNEFIYPDNYQSGIDEYKKLTGQQGMFKANAETSGRYHTDWLNMMYPRLMLARDMLIQDGVIFISIDDHEQSNLKKICDDIFGEGNFVANLIWQSTAGSNTGTDIVTVTEYILVYTKNKSIFKFDGMLASGKSYTLSDEYVNERGKFALDKLDRRRVGAHYSDALNYPITMPDGTLRYPGGYNTKSTEGWNYLWSKSKVEWGIKNGFIVFKKSAGVWSVYNKRYANIDNEGNFVERTIPFRNLILSDLYNTAQGTVEIRELFGSRPFDFPKPSGLLRHLLLTSVRSDKNAVVLDFFSGSASTAHAVIQLNSEDCGDRRFILVQLPEPCMEDSEAHLAKYKNICEVGKQRIRLAGKQIKEEAGLQGKDLDIGFRVYKLDSSNLRVWNPDVMALGDTLEEYAAGHLMPGRTQEDLLYEILLKSGIELTEDARLKELGGNRVYSLGHGQYYACMETSIKSVEELALGIAKWRQEENPDNTQCAVYVLDSAFATDADKVNFAKILEQHGIPLVKAL